MAKKTRLV